MFCSNCGKKSDENINFCPHCGKKINQNNYDKSKKKLVFSSSVLVGGNILTPDRLILDDNGVTYEKRNKYLIGVDSSYLSYLNISYVKIDRRLLSSDIIISSKGADSIIAKDFLISDAKKIEAIIKSKLNS